MNIRDSHVNLYQTIHDKTVKTLTYIQNQLDRQDISAIDQLYDFLNSFENLLRRNGLDAYKTIAHHRLRLLEIRTALDHKVPQITNQLEVAQLLLKQIVELIDIYLPIMEKYMRCTFEIADQYTNAISNIKNSNI